MSLWGGGRDLFVRHDSTKAGTENNKKKVMREREKRGSVIWGKMENGQPPQYFY